jgi:hypothetical protein
MIGFWDENGRPWEDRGGYCYYAENADDLSTESPSDDTSEWRPHARGRSARLMRRGRPLQQPRPPVGEINVYSLNGSSSDSSASAEHAEENPDFSSSSSDSSVSVQQHARGNVANLDDSDLEIINHVSECSSRE